MLKTAVTDFKRQIVKDRFFKFYKKKKTTNILKKKKSISHAFQQGAIPYGVA